MYPVSKNVLLLYSDTDADVARAAPGAAADSVVDALALVSA